LMSRANGSGVGCAASQGVVRSEVRVVGPIWSFGICRRWGLSAGPTPGVTTSHQELCCRLRLTMVANAATPTTMAGLPSAMFLAAEKGDAQAMAAWLDESGGVDARCAEHDGATLLMAATNGGQEATVRMLLQRGASVNLQDSGGITALILAAITGRTTTVQALLDAKADASLQTISGRTALMLAEQWKHTAAAQLLRQHTKRQAAEAEAGAAASMAHATAAADAMAAELLGEEAAEKEAAEKEAAAKKGKGKKKQARAPSIAAAESATAAPLAGAPKPAAAQEKLPDEPST
jgi:hypothetical protein